MATAVDPKWIATDADQKWTLEDLLRKATRYRDILNRKGLPTDNLEDKEVRRFYDAGLPGGQISVTLDRILSDQYRKSIDPDYEGNLTDPVWFDQRIKDLQKYGKEGALGPFPGPRFYGPYDHYPVFIDPDETPLPYVESGDRIHHLPFNEAARLWRDRRRYGADSDAKRKLDDEHRQKQKLTPVKYGYSYPGRGGQIYYQPESEKFKFPPESNQVNTQTPALAKEGAVPPAPAATNLNAARAGTKLGAAGNTNALLNSKYGALLNQAKLIGKHLAPQKTADPKDKWLTAFQFFTNMAAAASEPGATAIGAMGKAGAATVETLIEERKQKRAEELASTKMGVGLITALGKGLKASKPYVNQKTKKVEYFTTSEFNALTDKTSYLPYKAPGAGTDKERYTATVINIGPKIKSGKASDAEKAEYSIAYQQLSKGYTATTYDDKGNQQIIRVAGIDLTNLGEGIPSPDKFDANRLISSKSREWGTLGTNATFAQRMLFQEGIVREVLEGGYELNIRDVTADTMPSFIGTTLVSPEGQRFYAASRNFIAAVLRKESGAAISDVEYLNGLKQYFPQVGDTAEVMQDKESLRSAAIEGMVKESGDAFASIYPSAIPFLKFKIDDKVYNILNPRGYSAFELAKSKKGRSLYFNDSILAMSIEELKAMLGRSDASKRYTQQQLNKIDARIDELEERQKGN